MTSQFNPTSEATSFVFTELLKTLRNQNQSDEWAVRQAKLTWVEHRQLMKGMISKVSNLYKRYGSTSLSPEDSQNLGQLMSEMMWTMVESKFQNQ